MGFQGPKLNGAQIDPDDLVIVGIDVSQQDEDGQTHFLYDDRIELPLKEEFVLNVMTIGVKKNVICTNIDDKPYVVDGRQRVRAAREANKRLRALGEPPMRVPVTQQEGEEPLIMLVGISTNEFYTEDTQIAKARKAQRLRDRGLTDEEIATAFGVTTKAIGNWGKLLKLPAPVKKAVAAGELSPSAAAQMHTLPAEKQAEKLKTLLSKSKGKAPTIKDVQNVVKEATGKPIERAPSKKVLRYIVDKRKEHEVLSEDFVNGVAYAIGKRDASAISGLTAVLKGMKVKPAKKKVVKKKAASKKKVAKKKAATKKKAMPKKATPKKAVAASPKKAIAKKKPVPKKKAKPESKISQIAKAAQAAKAQAAARAAQNAPN